MSNSYTEESEQQTLTNIRHYALEIVLSSLCLFSVFLGVALFSYDPADAAWTQSSTIQITNNLAGELGALIADMSFFIFGTGAYFLPILIIAFSLATFLANRQLSLICFWAISFKLCGVIFLIISSCTLATLNIDDNPNFSSGGLVGSIVTLLLSHYVNGTIITLLMLLAWGLGFTILTRLSPLMVAEKLGDIVLLTVTFGRSRDKEVLDEVDPEDFEEDHLAFMQKKASHTQSTQPSNNSSNEIFDEDIYPVINLDEIDEFDEPVPQSDILAQPINAMITNPSLQEPKEAELVEPIKNKNINTSSVATPINAQIDMDDSSNLVNSSSKLLSTPTLPVNAIAEPDIEQSVATEEITIRPKIQQDVSNFTSNSNLGLQSTQRPDFIATENKTFSSELNNSLNKVNVINETSNIVNTINTNQVDNPIIKTSHNSPRSTPLDDIRNESFSAETTAPFNDNISEKHQDEKKILTLNDKLALLEKQKGEMPRPYPIYDRNTAQSTTPSSQHSSEDKKQAERERVRAELASYGIKLPPAQVKSIDRLGNQNTTITTQEDTAIDVSNTQHIQAHPILGVVDIDEYTDAVFEQINEDTIILKRVAKPMPHNIIPPSHQMGSQQNLINSNTAYTRSNPVIPTSGPSKPIPTVSPIFTINPIDESINQSVNPKVNELTHSTTINPSITPPELNSVSPVHGSSNFNTNSVINAEQSDHSVSPMIPNSPPSIQANVAVVSESNSNNAVLSNSIEQKYHSAPDAMPASNLNSSASIKSVESNFNSNSTNNIEPVSHSVRSEIPDPRVHPNTPTTVAPNLNANSTVQNEQVVQSITNNLSASSLSSNAPCFDDNLASNAKQQVPHSVSDIPHTPTLNQGLTLSPASLRPAELNSSNSLQTIAIQEKITESEEMTSVTATLKSNSEFVPKQNQQPTQDANSLSDIRSIHSFGQEPELPYASEHASMPLNKPLNHENSIGNPAYAEDRQNRINQTNSFGGTSSIPDPIFQVSDEQASNFVSTTQLMNTPDYHDTQLHSSPSEHENPLFHPLLFRENEKLEKPTEPLPTLDLLFNNSAEKIEVDQEEINRTALLIENTLADFRIKVTVVGICSGPVITRYELELAPGVKVARITTLDRDLARALSVSAVRVVEVIPGKPYVGLELPNPKRETLVIRDVLNCDAFREMESPLALVLGKDIGGEPVVANLAKMPHLLVAGTTGSGKSVGVNAMIISILFKASPDEVRFIMIDPKMLELSIYEGIPHLLTQVVTDMKDAANALRWSVAEMERRYKLMAALGVRNLDGYNEKIKQAEAMQRPIPDPFWKPSDSMDLSIPSLEKLPFIVVIVDEFADLIMTEGKKVEELIARLAQKARAAGIHLILATQRPSVDVITGLIKANIPTRIAFTVSSKIDSRTILDQGGAESLLGAGDMLYLPPNSSTTIRVHGAFVADEEVHNVVSNWKARGKPQYIDAITAGEKSSDDTESGEEEVVDAVFDAAVQFVIEKQRVSISGIQRQFRIGYNRAARIVEEMEAQGIVSPPAHNGNREVLAQ